MYLWVMLASQDRHWTRHEQKLTIVLLFLEYPQLSKCQAEPYAPETDLIVKVGRAELLGPVIRLTLFT